MTQETKLRRMSLFLALLLSAGTGMACDREDVRDVEETINDVEEGAEKVGEEVEEEIDQIDTDGKDD